jgi:glycoprotein endo-alpha-1,2-mannosidase
MRLAHVTLIAIASFCVSLVATQRFQTSSLPPSPASVASTPPAKQVWILYNTSWGKFETDNLWVNWRLTLRDFPSLSFEPPDTIPSVHFPQAGLYSSRHPATVKSHMAQIKAAGIDAVVIPWRGPSDESSKLVCKYANRSGLQVAIFVPEIHQRTFFVRLELPVFHYRYGYVSLRRNGRPIVVVERPSLMADFHGWASEMRSFIIGTAQNAAEALDAREDGVDAIVSFYAAGEDSELADPRNWREVAETLAKRGIGFVPTIAPGINETALSVQMAHRARSRKNGEYYDRMWEAVIASGADTVLINSFNNWSQGTVIEPVSHNMKFPLNEDIWVGTDANYFLKKTREWIDRYRSPS